MMELARYKLSLMQPEMVLRQAAGVWQTLPSKCDKNWNKNLRCQYLKHYLHIAWCLTLNNLVVCFVWKSLITLRIFLGAMHSDYKKARCVIICQESWDMTGTGGSWFRALHDVDRKKWWPRVGAKSLDVRFSSCRWFSLTGGNVIWSLFWQMHGLIQTY